MFELSLTIIGIGVGVLLGRIIPNKRKIIKEFVEDVELDLKNNTTICNSCSLNARKVLNNHFQIQ